MGSLSDEERRWIVVGVCLTKVIPPALRNVLATELRIWYNLLCQPPDEIDKQVFARYKKTLPPSTLQLNYKSINNNDKSPGAYDFAVKDSLSLAKLFVQPGMAKFTGFDDTMDMSAILAVMCKAKPFSSAAADVEIVRTNIRNKWAHCNFSEWTQPVFTASIQSLKLLVKKTSLSAADQKVLCDKLDDWEKKGLGLCFGQPVTELVTELRTSVIETLKFEAEIKTVKEKLNNLESKLLCRIEEVEKRVAENSKGVKRHSVEIERHSNELECHSNELKYLSIKLRTEDHDKQKENYSEFADKKVPYGLRNLPRDMVERPAEVNEILGLLMQGNNRVGVVGIRSGDVFGIRGMGGLGKTVLAQAVAWAASDSRQVIWLDIGETPDCLALINILIKVLGGTVSFSDIYAAQAWVKANTSDKDSLVVLDDVWSVDDVAVFDHLSGKCQLLITTRDAKVVRGSRGFVYELQFMAQDKSRALLHQSARVKADELSTFSTEMHQIVKELLNQCRGLPLALSLVGSNLIDTRILQDWQDVLEDLQNADLIQLHSQFPAVSYPYDNLLAAIDASFQRLEKREREKFLDLGIFPEDINVPSDILELLWSSEGDGRTSCSPREGRRILNSLERKSLLQKGPELQGKTSYRVHDLLLDFARTKLGATGTLTDVQCLFVKTLRGQCVNGEWTITSSTCQKDYYFKYLPYHIFSSKHHSELIQLFFDFYWLEQKVIQTDLPSLISDFRFLYTPSHEIKLLKSSLMLSAHLIEKNPNSIGPQLLGRLLSYIDECPSVKKLLEHVRETCVKTCHLLPLFSCLKLEGPDIFKKNFNSYVNSLATSNSSTGAIVISGLENGSIHIHELETGKELQIFEGHTRGVTCLAVSHSGATLASGSTDYTTRLWNIDSYEQLFVLQGEGVVVGALDFSADDHRLFTGSHDGKLRVWCVATGELLNVIPAHDDWINSLCTTKDGLYVATASVDPTIKLWKADTLNIEATLVGHSEDVNCVVAAGNDNPMLVSASNDGTLKIWDVKTKQDIRTLHGDFGNVIRSVAVSSDTKHIISVGDYTIVKLWCFHTGELLSCFEGHRSCIRSVTITSDGSKALSGSDDRSFRVWDLDSSAYLKQDRSRGHSVTVIDIAVTQDGSRCVCASSDGTFKIWKCESAEECFTLRDKETAAKVAISADDRHVVSLSKDSLSSSIKVCDLLDGSEITGIELDNTAKLVRFSSDGRLVIIGCDDERVFIWDWQNRDVKCVTLPSSFDATEIACDVNMIYTCSRNMEVCQIDLGSLKVSTVRQESYRNWSRPMVILPDGRASLSGILTDSSFIYWYFVIGSEIKCNAGHSDGSIVTAIDITSNGKLAVSGSSSGTISLMNLASSKEFLALGKTEAGVGIRLVSVLGDSRFVFVDEANKIELRTFMDKKAGLVLGQPAVKVTCITAHGVDYLLLGCENGELLLFNLHFIEYKYKHQAHSEAVCQVKSDPTSFLHFFVSGSASGCVKLWYVTKIVPPLWSQIWSHDNVYPYPISALAFVPHSREIVIGSFDSNKVCRINAAGIVRTYQFDGHEIAALRVVGDSLIAAGWGRERDGVRRVAAKWSLSEKLGTERFSSYSHGVEHVSNASSHVASIDAYSLLIWNFKTGRTPRRVFVHTQYNNANYHISALAFVLGGEFLLSGSDDDNTLKLWNLQNGRLVEEFHFDQSVRAIACASNGMVCVGLRDGRVSFLRFNNLSSHSGQLEQ